MGGRLFGGIWMDPLYYWVTCPECGFRTLAGPPAARGWSHDRCNQAEWRASAPARLSEGLTHDGPYCARGAPARLSKGMGRAEPAGGRNRSPHVQGERQTLSDGSFQLMQSVTMDAPKTQTWVMRRVDAHRYTATPDRCLGTGRGRGGWRPIPPELRDGVAGWWADATMYVIAARWALGRERGDHEPPWRGRGPALGTNHAGRWPAGRVIVTRPVR
jgi:hypothetical protein